MEALGLLLVLVVLAIPVCAFVALGLAIGARRRLEEANDHWKKRVRELTLRMEELEKRHAPPPAQRVAPVAAPAPKPPPRPPEPVPVRAPEPVPLVEELTEPPSLAPLPETRAAGPSLEERIGGRWFNWVGILAILFGVAYAMKYSFEQGWITPVMRFWGGLLLGGGLLAAGTFSERRSYAILARGFWGGGIGVLFVVFFAGFKLLLVGGEPILSRGAAFAGMAATVVAGVLIAIRYDTRTTAVLSAIGGYVTPILLRTGVPDQVFLFTYLLILTGGLLFLGYWKRWGFLRLLTFTVVVCYFAGWWITEGTGAPWAMLLYPSLLFLFFAAEILAWSVWRRVADDSLSYVVLGLAATFHALSGLGGAGVQYFRTAPRGRDDPRRPERGPPRLRLPAGVGERPVRDDRALVPLRHLLAPDRVPAGAPAPARDGPSPALARAGRGLLLLPAGERAAQLFLHARFLSLGASAAGLLLGAELYRRAAPGAPLLRLGTFVEGAPVAVPFSVGGHALVMLLLTLEAADRFHLEGAEEHMRQLSYSLLWAAYAIGMVAGGFLRRYRPVRLMALAVLVGTVSFLYQKYRHVLA